jgi:acetyl esterase/lipase
MTAMARSAAMIRPAGFLIALMACLAVPSAAAPLRLMSAANYLAAPQATPAARLRYGPSSSQVVDLFTPPGKGPYPVVVMIHGGCWLRQFEGLRQTSGLAADLARRGLAVWNIDYRGVDEPGGGYPGTYQDVSAALDLLSREAPARDLDLTRVVAVGHSAGGHLALWAAARRRLPAKSPLHVENPLRIRTVVGVGAVSDLDGQANAIRRSCGFDPARLEHSGIKDTSPPDLLPSGVKAVIIHGDHDAGFPVAAGRAYVAKARKAGDVAELVVLPTAGHFEPVTLDRPAWRKVAARIEQEVALLPRHP